jgi:hypothetical protein
MGNGKKKPYTKGSGLPVLYMAALLQGLLGGTVGDEHRNEPAIYAPRMRPYIKAALQRYGEEATSEGDATGLAGELED